MTEEPRHDRPAAAARGGKSTNARPGAQPRTSAERAASALPGSERQPRVSTRAKPDRYLVAGTDPRAVAAALEQDESSSVVRTVPDQATGNGISIVIAEMPPERAAAIAARAGIYVEPDLQTGRGQPAVIQAGEPAAPPVLTQHVVVEVADDGGRPVEGAAVTLTGSGLAGTGFTGFTGFTGADGRADVLVTPEALTSIALAEVHPPRGRWPVRLRRPRLAQPVKVTCPRITATHPGFPERALDSWGARAMGFGRLPPTYRGHGVRIALIDSGAATGHPDLASQIQYGRDILRQDEKSWQEDLTGTGTHMATLISGRDDDSGIVGLAPEAEAHVCRVAPGGSVASLIEALDYCIEQRIDVAVVGTRIEGYSALLAAKVEQAWQHGIACVGVAGGFPGQLPQVLGVGAIGQLGTFPPESTDTASLTVPLSPEGFFMPAFSPRGADCCAPGVAIVAGLPPASYGPLSSTATAAAHVAALAALTLAHHPLFRPEPGTGHVSRDATRPARLFELIKASCRPLPYHDPGLTGAGVPDAAIALGIAAPGAYPAVPLPYPAPVPGPDGRLSLEPLTAAMAAAGLLQS